EGAGLGGRVDLVERQHDDITAERLVEVDRRPQHAQLQSGEIRFLPERTFQPKLADPSQTAARQSHDVQLEAVTQELIKRSAHIRAPAEREVIARRESERDGRHQSKRPVLAIAGETGRVSHLDNAFIDGIENLVRWYNRAGRKRFDTHASA